MLIRTSQHDADWLDRFLKAVQSRPEVIEAHRLAGDIDYILKVRVPNARAYDAFYRALIKEVSIFNVTSVLSMEEIKSTTALPVAVADAGLTSGRARPCYDAATTRSATAMTHHRDHPGLQRRRRRSRPRTSPRSRRSGYRSIMCNRPDGEDPGQPPVAEIRAEAERLGLAFAFVPVISGGIDAGDVADFRAAAGTSCRRRCSPIAGRGRARQNLWLLAQR